MTHSCICFYWFITTILSRFRIYMCVELNMTVQIVSSILQPCFLQTFKSATIRPVYWLVLICISLIVNQHIFMLLIFCEMPVQVVCPFIILNCWWIQYWFVGVISTLRISIACLINVFEISSSLIGLHFHNLNVALG